MAKERPQKGNYIREFLDEYCVVDIETTGLSPEYCEIIEIAAVKVRNGEMTESYSSLIKPRYPINSFISQLTGITNAAVRNERPVEVVLPEFLTFLGDTPVVGHNVTFDLSFLYDWSERVLCLPVKNDYSDTMKLARTYCKGLPNYKLGTLAEVFGVANPNAHRALADCVTTMKCYEIIRRHACACTK